MPDTIKLVILESPFAGDRNANVAYARRAAHDCAMRGESPQASHLLFTQFMNDFVPAERELGIALGLAWRRVADYSVFYTDRGWSSGMNAALDSAIAERRPFVLRAIDGPIKMPTYRKMVVLCESDEAPL
ncbi:hypothetical protein [Rhodopseudomonas palustris]|uniref:DUF7768 domain-containing protein n=1 Tax=Rhodopseudomonas palustris TaxID=1076 RepID=UPI0006425141|nr:hypothetical protein [Rhodopseudomonas palustris]